MTRTSLDDAPWASLMLTMQQIPRAWKRNASRARRDGAAAVRRGRAVDWLDGCAVARPTGRPGPLAQRLPPFSALVGARLVGPSVRGAAPRGAVRATLPADGLVLLDSITCKAHRAASGAARSTAETECLGRSRGGLCSKLHACADGAGRILRLIPSPGQHSDLRHAPALVSGIPAHIARTAR